MHRLVLLLSATTIAFAEAGPGGSSAPGGAPADGAQAAGGGSLFAPLLMVVMMIAIFYFLAIRPQKKEEKRRKELIDATKPGDTVVTIGGAHGTVERVGEHTVDVRFGSGNQAVVIPFNKSAIASNQSATKAAERAADKAATKSEEKK